MDEKDMEKTDFSTEQGHYKFRRMPLDLKTAVSTFQRRMDNVLKGLQDEYRAVYVDDLIIFSTSLQEHLERLQLVFERLRQHNFKIQLDKSEFLRKEVAYLGHVITPSGVKPNPDKISAVMKYPIPKSTKEIKAFLGLLGYYRRFIQNFAQLTKPLTKCLKRGAKIEHSNEFIQAFENSKQVLVNHPILQYPDFTKPFILTTDASNIALGAVLSQGIIGSDKPIAYASRTLSETEQKYSTIEKELLGIVWATKYFRPYLYGRKFVICTDHRPLLWLFKLKEPNAKLTRWRLRLQEYDYEIAYKKGKLNVNADALSRIEINALDDLENASMIVNPDDELDNFINNLTNNNDTNDKFRTQEYEELIEDLERNCQDINENPGTSSSTIHSTEDREPNSGIPILNEAIDNKPNQFIIKTVYNGSITSKTQKEENRTIHKVNVPQDCDVREILNFLREYTTKDEKYYFFFDREATYKKFCEVYCDHFSQQGPKIIRCTNRLVTIIHKEIQEDLIKNHHEGKTNHRGITETMKQLQRKYFWKNMKTSVIDYINSCDICKKTKYDRKPPLVPMMLTETADKPFQQLNIDTFTIEKENFVTIIDAFTKLGQAIHITSKNSIEITKALIEFFKYYGVPKSLTMDNGTEFKNDTVRQCLELHKIDVHYITPNNPSSNGLIERLHSTIIEHIRLLKQTNNEPIKNLMNYAIIAYNNSIHSATGFTPLELVFGHTNTRCPFEIFYDKTYYQDYVNTHKEKLKHTYERVKENMVTNKEKVQEKKNENCKESSLFSIGQKVFEKDVSARNKTKNRYTGPYIISKIYPNNTADITKNNKTKRIHLKLLRRPIVTDGSSSEEPPDPLQ